MELCEYNFLSFVGAGAGWGGEVSVEQIIIGCFDLRTFTTFRTVLFRWLLGRTNYNLR